MNVTGVSTTMNTLSSPPNTSANFSAFSFARLLGIISPKMSIRTVIAAVAIPTPFAPKSSVHITVPNDVERIFTILFPTRIVVRVLSKFSAIFSALVAFLLPFDASCLRRILFTDENAVSVAEKNADMIISKIIAAYSIK